MHPKSEPRRGGVAGAVFAVVVIALMGYLTFAALQGEHGLFRLFQIEAQEKRLRHELDALRADREAIANKTRRLSTGHARSRPARRTGPPDPRPRPAPTKF